MKRLALLGLFIAGASILALPRLTILGRADAPAYQALADAAGGADQVAAYCAAETPTSAGHGQRPEAPPAGAGEHAKASPPTTGPPADPGNGHDQGQGGPPTTTA